jgi:hypothetical protein
VVVAFAERIATCGERTLPTRVAYQRGRRRRTDSRHRWLQRGVKVESAAFDLLHGTGEAVGRNLPTADGRECMASHEFGERVGAMACFGLRHRDATPAEREPIEAERRAFVRHRCDAR